ncbi:MAG: adenylosuccinate synthase [Planctomycetes bacterium]|nr:adenylosuccinate synthase [Planctomycetota bacterium]
MRQGSKHVCVVGIQWGDEGKGKIVDVLSAEFDVVVRYQGGANAGHTVKIGEREFVFHLIPSGILQEGKVCVIGNGVVLDPRALIDELDQLRRFGIDHEENLWISDRAHVVLPYHRLLDSLRESSASGDRIGTTQRGIGPCYTDKAARLGIRMVDLVDPDRFRALLERNLAAKNAELQRLHGLEPLDLGAVSAEYLGYAERLRPRVRDIGQYLRDTEREGKRILFEGAQGSLLDVDLGTYPFVTSSNTSFLGLGAGTGFSPRKVGTVLGITKAYSTRVGEGPFPTELKDETGDRLRKLGREFGATTGRPRRCGWLDFVAIRYAISFGDIDALAITKLDVLDGFGEILASTGYRAPGGPVGSFPTRADVPVEPVYRAVPGWRRDISRCRSLAELPQETQAYLQFIADESRCPIAMVSVGKERCETIRLDPWLQPSRGGMVAAHG